MSRDEVPTTPFFWRTVDTFPSNLTVSLQSSRFLFAPVLFAWEKEHLFPLLLSIFFFSQSNLGHRRIISWAGRMQKLPKVWVGGGRIFPICISAQMSDIKEGCALGRDFQKLTFLSKSMNSHVVPWLKYSFNNRSQAINSYPSSVLSEGCLLKCSEDLEAIDPKWTSKQKPWCATKISLSPCWFYFLWLNEKWRVEGGRERMKERERIPDA